MEITVVGRHLEVPERFRRHLDDKLEKITQLAPKATRVAVEISHENNPRQSGTSERIELTVHDAGPVIRAEARADDLYAALDVAYGRLLERLRRARDRRKDQHGAKRHHQTLRTAAPEAGADPLPSSLVEAVQSKSEAPPQPDAAPESAPDFGESPVVIRQKVHESIPMSLDEALYEMELVGHDFYMFFNKETSNINVIYRRKGWNYGVLALEESA